MTRVFKSELRRALSRRMVRVTALLVATGIVLAGVITVLKSQVPRELNAGDAARVESCVQGNFSHPDFEHSEDPGAERASFDRQYPVGSDERRGFCANFVRSDVESKTFRLKNLGGILKATAGMMVIVALLFGASLIGAEWRSGSLATTLTWDPRRTRLALAKVLAAIVASVMFVIAAQALIALVLWAAAALRGSVAGAGVDLAQTIIGEQARLLLLIAFATMFGFAVGMLGKNTAATLGVSFGYIIIFEQILLIVEWLRPWLILPNAVTFISGGIADDFLVRSATEAGITLAAYALGLLGISMLMFQKRDVLA